MSCKCKKVANDMNALVNVIDGMFAEMEVVFNRMDARLAKMEYVNPCEKVVQKVKKAQKSKKQPRNSLGHFLPFA